MIDLAAFASLFFEASKEWRTPNVARFGILEDANKEDVVQKLISKGHTLQWVDETRLRRLKENGWSPVTERDKIGRPTIFMDRLSELVLVHRPPRHDT
jgi:hypothetical protein